ncbi:MAG: alpha/beta fold hydrolase [Bryobacteraceae bacterium]
MGGLQICFSGRLRIARSVPLSFGDDLKGDLYLPVKTEGRMPVVIWLHPYAYSTGYSRNAGPTIADLTQQGFAVFAFDQIGFGTRIHQAGRFYERYPKWSLLGKMVADTRAAVDALVALKEVDRSKLYLAGYSLGGKVALWTAALDTRVAGVIAASAATTLRTASRQRGSAPLLASSWIIAAPRFLRRPEAEVPVDYTDYLR